MRRFDDETVRMAAAERLLDDSAEVAGVEPDWVATKAASADNAAQRFDPTRPS